MCKDPRETYLPLLKERLTGHIVRYVRHDDGSVTFVTSDNQRLTVRNLKVEPRGSHVLVSDRRGDWVILPLAAKQVRSRALSALRHAILALVAAVASGVLVNSLFLRDHPEPEPVSSKLAQLSRVREALRDLDAYIQQQEVTLRDISSTLASIRDERDSLQTFLSTDRKQVAAVLKHARSRSALEKRIGWGIAFVIGFLSSLAASLVWNYFRTVRRLAQQEGGGNFG